MANDDDTRAAEMANIADRLCCGISTASDEEILEDARAAGEDPVKLAAEVRAALIGAVKDVAQRPLRKARAEFDQRRSSRPATFSFQMTLAEKQSLFSSVVGRHPEVGGLVTMRHRDFRELAESDLDVALAQFLELGLIDEERKPK